MAEILEYPNIPPTSFTINLVSNAKSFKSVFNNSMMTHSFPGAYWSVSLTYSNLDDYDADELSEMQAFIWSLNGMNGRFTMPVFTKRGGAARGVPLSSISGQNGSIIETKGWNSSTLVLKRGDFIQIGYELKVVTSDVWSNSLGNADIPIAPPMRDTVGINEPIITDSPSGLFALADNSQGQFTIEQGANGSVTISCNEQFYISEEEIG